MGVRAERQNITTTLACGGNNNTSRDTSCETHQRYAGDDAKLKDMLESKERRCSGTFLESFAAA